MHATAAVSVSRRRVKLPGNKTSFGLFGKRLINAFLMAAHRLLLVLGLFGRAGALCTSAGAACAGGVPGWVRIADSPGKGRGAFASVAIPPRQTVGDYRGELISQREIDARYEGGSPTAEDEQWRASRLARGMSLGGDYIARVLHTHI